MRKTRDLYSLGLRLLQYPLVAIDRRISRNASSVKAVSRGCAQELQQLYGICPEKVVVIPTGVDTAFFTPAEKLTTATPYVLYAARLDARKGIEDFVECATYVCREKPETKFVVAGGGYLATKMKRKVHTAGLDGNFQFTGFVSQRVLLQYYREASVYILPSYYEGNPHSLLEAMSCATPCIATQVIGSSEIIVDNESGFLVPPGNPARLAEATLTLLDNKQLRKKIGENARSRVLQNYDFNTIVDRIEEWYRRNLR
jgi:glycosyltransferase involved in cell wall biosynthesis